tara:strand:- start:731 stop:1477 length:747 start_codon:yes stop_codon:yes gene_type:complete
MLDIKARVKELLETKRANKKRHQEIMAEVLYEKLSQTETNNVRKIFEILKQKISEERNLYHWSHTIPPGKSFQKQPGLGPHFGTLTAAMQRRTDIQNVAAEQGNQLPADTLTTIPRRNLSPLKAYSAAARYPSTSDISWELLNREGLPKHVKGSIRHIQNRNMPRWKRLHLRSTQETNRARNPNYRRENRSTSPTHNAKKILNNRQLDKIKDTLHGAGYRSFKYPNHAEDSGRSSYVVFDPEEHEGIK